MSVLRIRIAVLRLTVYTVKKISLLPRFLKNKIMTFVINQICEIGKILYPKKIN